MVAAGHGCGRDGVEPSGRRAFWSGLEEDVDFPKPSWHRSMRHETVFGGKDASASTEPAVSNTGGRWELNALPGLLPLVLEVVEREGTKTVGVVEVESLYEQV